MKHLKSSPTKLKGSPLSKWLYTAFPLLFVCFLWACNEDLDKWKVFELDYTISLNENEKISHKGSTVTIEVQSNAAWLIAGLPEWITADKTEGEGCASVQLTIKPNPNSKKRSCQIHLTKKDDDTFSQQTAGYKECAFSITQEGKYDALKVTIQKAWCNKSKVGNESKGPHVYNYKGGITYHIDSNLSEEERKALFPNIVFRIDYTGYKSSYFKPEDAGWATSTKEPIDISNGTHTLNIDMDMYELYGIYTNMEVRLKYDKWDIDNYVILGNYPIK